jgi:hypothetical protein
VLAALILPTAAFAHVGKSAPVATNFQARLSGITPASAVEGKVVDGDRALWLRVNANSTILIPGAESEPLLRFDRSGVFVSLRSLTAQSDRIDHFDLRPDPNPHPQPLWHRLSSGHSYLWHAHRLHALEPLARGHRATAVLGRWSVPLLLNGRREALVGTLIYRARGSALPWILIACALAVISSGALVFSAGAARRLAVGVALVTMLLVWAVRIGRELYGRPSVGVTGYVEIALTSLVGFGLLYGLSRRDQGVRVFTAFLVGFGCLYEGLTMLPVLTHAVALTVLSTLAARLAVAAILGPGVGVFAVTLREQFREGAIAGTPDVEAASPRRSARPIRRAGPA